MTRFGKVFRVGIAALLLATPLTGMAEDTNSVSGDRATDMVVDVLVVRPLGLATTAIGTLLTIVALPFTIPSGSVKASVETLIENPAEYTFKRPLGEFGKRD